MAGELFYLGVTHRTSGAEWRGRLRCDETMRRRFLADLAAIAAERLIVSTCGRFEIYAIRGQCAAGTRHEEIIEVARFRSRLFEQFCGWFGMTVKESAPHLRHAVEEEASLQLLRVAAGLESRILGEPQILSQVRQSFDEAVGAGAVGPILSALCRAAIHTGKRVRRETAINQSAVSSATLAVQYVQRRLGSLRGRLMVLLGTGHLARDVVGALAGRGARLYVVGREIEAAGRIASSAGGIGLGFVGLQEVLTHAEGVFVCTASPTFLIQGSMIAHRTWPLTIVDLAVPRNVDPAVGEMDSVGLIHLDELIGFSREESGPATLRARRGGEEPPAESRAIYSGAVREAMDIVSDELQRFQSWRRHRVVAGRIEQLVRAAEAQAGDDLRAVRRQLHRQILILKASVAA